MHSRLIRGVSSHLEGKQRIPLSSRVPTGISWSPQSGLKGVRPPVEFEERPRQHTQQPPPPQALARSFARLLTSLPFLGYNFAQMRPLAVLSAPPWLPPPAFASGSRSASLAHHGVCLPTLHSPLVSDSSHWRIPWMEPGGLQSLGSLRVGHHRVTSLSLFPFKLLYFGPLM